MKNTWKQIKEFAERSDIPDDAEIWIEYPDQLATPIEMDEIVISGPKYPVEEFTAIRSMSMVWMPKKNKFIIQHHF